MTLRPPVHIHIHEGAGAEALAQLEEKVDLLMAQIDDVQNSITELDTAVRAHLAGEQGTIDALQAEIDRLLADDSVEDSKLEGIQAQTDALRSAVVNFGGEPEPA